MIEQDYIMKIIHETVIAIGKLLFHNDIENDEIVISDESSKDLYKRLNKGDINRAEDLLYEEVDLTNIGNLEAALLFYDDLNSLTDEELEQANFSREEVEEGIKEILKNYGYGDLIDLFIE